MLLHLFFGEGIDSTPGEVCTSCEEATQNVLSWRLDQAPHIGACLSSHSKWCPPEMITKHQFALHLITDSTCRCATWQRSWP